MTPADPLACRRALREIREIAAVAHLEGAQMSEEDALKAIGAIAAWADDGIGDPTDCGDILHRLDAMVAAQDLDGMADATVVALFGDVMALLQHGAASARTAPAK